MREVDRLADLVERVMEGDPWHGSNVESLLEGVTPAMAARTIAGSHSIWQLVLHLTGWTNEARARLEGEAAAEPAGGDWPPVPSVQSAAGWAEARRRLTESHRALAAALRASDDAALMAPVVDHRDAAAGTGLSKYLTLHGLVHHTTYHAGQIALLRRMLAQGD